MKLARVRDFLDGCLSALADLQVRRARPIVVEVQWQRPMVPTKGNATVLLPPDTPISAAFGLATAELASGQTIDGDVVAITIYRRADIDAAVFPEIDF